MAPRVTATFVASALVTLVGCASREVYLARLRDRLPEPVHFDTYEEDCSFGYGGFGYVSKGRFAGDHGHLSAGSGASITVPLAPGTAFFVALMGISALAGGGGGSFDFDGAFEDVEPWHSGRSNSNIAPLSEASLEFTFSGTSHTDESTGHSVAYHAALIGGKLGTPRARLLRIYGTAGWGLYRLYAEDAPDAAHNGPYLGWGIDLVPYPAVTIGVDWRRHFHTGGDRPDDPATGASQTIVNINFYW